MSATQTPLAERPGQGRGIPPAAGAAGPTRSIEVVLASAHPALTAVLAHRLGQADRCELRETIDTIAEARRALAEHAADVLVIDLTLVAAGEQREAGPDPDRVLEALAALHPLERTVAVLAAGEPAGELARRAFALGLGSLLIADDDLGNGNLAYAVRQVGAGRLCYGPTVQALLAAQAAAWTEQQAGARSALPYELTERELEALRLVATGLRRGEIAERFGVSWKTVKSHLNRGRHKLGVADPEDRAAIARRLAEAGLLERPDQPGG